MKKLVSLALPILLAIAAFFGCSESQKGTSSAVSAGGTESSPQSASQNGPASSEGKSDVESESPSAVQGNVVYRNDEYGFEFALPESWKGYKIVETAWKANGGQISGPEILIRHPKWAEDAPRQDIPIMVFTSSQWEALENDEFHIGSAPSNPTQLGRNSRYVFALPARYNFEELDGAEEVEKILSENHLKAFDK